MAPARLRFEHADQAVNQLLLALLGDLERRILLRRKVRFDGRINNRAKEIRRDRVKLNRDAAEAL
jgi:hypothetical protein